MSLLSWRGLDIHEWVALNVLIQPSESLWTELSNHLSNAVATDNGLNVAFHFDIARVRGIPEQ